MRWSAAGGFGPVVAPQTTIRPPARRPRATLPRRLADVLDDDVGAPPPVASLTAATTSPVAWFTAASAPSSRARSSFSSLDEVTSTRAPSAFAIASAAVATPPPIPQTSTHSPSCSRPLVTSIRYAVSNTSGKAAASSNESSSGSG